MLAGVLDRRPCFLHRFLVCGRWARIEVCDDRWVVVEMGEKVCGYSS